MTAGVNAVVHDLARTCSACGVSKPAAAFVKDPGRARCKACHAADQSAYRKRHPARVREQKERWRRANPETVQASRRRNKPYNDAYNHAYKRDPAKWVEIALRNAKKRAAESGVDFDLTPADVFLPEFCPVLGIRLEIGRPGRLGKGSGFGHASPSLDRIIPSRGYVRGNVAVISMRANLLKRDGSVEELERIVAWLRAVQ